MAIICYYSFMNPEKSTHSDQIEEYKLPVATTDARETAMQEKEAFREEILKGETASHNVEISQSPSTEQEIPVRIGNTALHGADAEGPTNYEVYGGYEVEEEGRDF